MNADWTRDATMRLLNAAPLPPTFEWPHRDGGEHPVRPSHGVVTGYGKWLRETPYFPGLFELCHDLLTTAPEEVPEGWLEHEIAQIRARFVREPLRPGEHLAHQLRRLLPAANQPTLF